jgi:hypothetical protein
VRCGDYGWAEDCAHLHSPCLDPTTMSVLARLRPLTAVYSFVSIELLVHQLKRGTVLAAS